MKGGAGRRTKRCDEAQKATVDGNASKHAHLSSRHQKRCFKKGYHIGYDNAAADLNKDEGSNNPYEAGSNEYEYYSDGCMAGEKDGRANMSECLSALRLPV